MTLSVLVTKVNSSGCTGFGAVVSHPEVQPFPGSIGCARSPGFPLLPNGAPELWISAVLPSAALARGRFDQSTTSQASGLQSA